MADEKLAGLPEGVELVSFGTAGPEDYEISRHPDGSTTISKGVRPLASSGVIVRAAEGYIFKQDIRTLNYYPVKRLAEPLKLTATGIFQVNDAEEEAAVRQLFGRARSLPWCVDITIT